MKLKTHLYFGDHVNVKTAEWSCEETGQTSPQGDRVDGKLLSCSILDASYVSLVRLRKINDQVLCQHFLLSFWVSSLFTVIENSVTQSCRNRLVIWWFGVVPNKVVTVLTWRPTSGSFILMNIDQVCSFVLRRDPMLFPIYLMVNESKREPYPLRITNKEAE